MTRCLFASMLVLVFTAGCFAQKEAPDRVAQERTWEDLIVDKDAIELAQDHPDVAKIKMLKKILLPPQTASQADVEEIYGRHIRIDEPNAKEPGRRHVYAPLAGLHLKVVYSDEKVKSSWFVCDDAQAALISRRISEPRYSELDHDLSLEFRLLSQLLVKTKRPSDAFPWSNSPARGVSTR